MKINLAFKLCLSLLAFTSLVISAELCGSGNVHAVENNTIIAEPVSTLKGGVLDSVIQKPDAEEVSEGKESNVCEISINADDRMSYSINEFIVNKSCEEFTIHFQNIGKIPKSTMGHNVVISKHSDTQFLASEGMSAGAEHDFLPPNDSRIIAKTPILGGGEKASVTFSTTLLNKEDKYEFFCSFPGHFFTMRGNVIVE